MFTAFKTYFFKFYCLEDLFNILMHPQFDLFPHFYPSYYIGLNQIDKSEEVIGNIDVYHVIDSV